MCLVDSYQQQVLCNMQHLDNDKKVMLLLHYERLLMKMHKVDVEYTTVKELCDFYSVSVNYAAELRKTFFLTGTLQRKEGSGRPSIDKNERIQAITDAVRAKRDCTIEDIAGATNIPRSSVARLLQEDNMQLVSKRSIPLLNDMQKESRLKFCRKYRYNQWDTWVDIDEKWFEVSHTGKERYHLDSPRKRAACQSKGNIKKLMILSAVAKPRPEYQFSGLIGIWRITEDYTAQRSSINHERGEVYQRDCTITANSYYNIMTECVIPAIHERMIFAQNIFIQQDNAKPHVGKNNVKKINDFGDLNVPNTVLLNQPAQSPELNINDLGFFHSLSKRAQKEGYETLDQLWLSVQNAYWTTASNTLLNLWMLKSEVIKEIITAKGGSIDLPHSNIRQNSSN